MSINRVVKHEDASDRVARLLRATVRPLIALACGLLVTNIPVISDTVDPVVSDAAALDAGVEDEAEGLGDIDDMLDLDLEQLMQIDVTSVAGVEQPWFKTPAAMYVLTGEDIRRAGHTSIPEALRMVPGLNVARNNSWMWSISARGFQQPFSNKLQVLMDGRELYDPLFAGTLWDIHNVVMDDLERIEVIRGPGATLWGSNAVNGVINITSKHTKDTQGLLMSSGIGTFDRQMHDLRYGDQLSESAWFRVWGKYHATDKLHIPGNGDGDDDWDMLRGGFRIDTETDDAFGQTTLSIQGDLHQSNRLGEEIDIPVTGHRTTVPLVSDGRAEGFSLLVNLEHEQSEDSGWRLKGYYTRTSRVGIAQAQFDRDFGDLDFQQYFKLDETHDLIWGINGRLTSDDTQASVPLSFTPTDRHSYKVTAFIQDTMTLEPDTLFVMVGTKIEDNDFTGFDYQPSARIWWTPDEDHTLWAAVSRALRVPSRNDNDVTYLVTYVDTGLIAGGPPSGIIVPLFTTSTRDLQPETMTAIEAGYRQRFGENLTLDVAGFYNDYEELVTIPAGEFVGMYDNIGSATTYGVETSVDWLAAENWRIVASHSYIYMKMDANAARTNLTVPRHQFQVRSELDITDELELNTAVYYYDKSSLVGVMPASSDGFVRLDVGLTWRPSSNLEVTVWGQNLLDPGHYETVNALPLTDTGEIPRSAYLQLTYRF